MKGSSSYYNPLSLSISTAILPLKNVIVSPTLDPMTPYLSSRFSGYTTSSQAKTPSTSLSHASVESLVVSHLRRTVSGRKIDADQELQEVLRERHDGRSIKYRQLPPNRQPPPLPARPTLIANPVKIAKPQLISTAALKVRSSNVPPPPVARPLVPLLHQTRHNRPVFHHSILPDLPSQSTSAPTPFRALLTSTPA